jgi:hypothetical protein
MDQTPLVAGEIEAGRELVARLDTITPIRAAFWAREIDESRWYLYIASDRFHGPCLAEGYRDVFEAIHAMDRKDLDPFQVKLIGADDPLALAARDIQERYPDLLPTRLGTQVFGGMSVGGVYLYPPPAATAVV